ncbi:Asp-tRNA(Asn)/Glu-tRNA(Gln) amidotransferase A subunit family amidase [Bradyrhizobium elkanii]
MGQELANTILDRLSWAEFSYSFNTSWNPLTSLSWGFPLGLKTVGKRLDDLDVLQASAVFEQLPGWANNRPRL